MLNGSTRTPSMGPARVAAGCVAALLLLGNTVNAQNTFEVIAQGAVSDAPGLRAMTVRDNSIAVCYTVFIMQLSTPPLTVPATRYDASVQSEREIPERWPWASALPGVRSGGQGDGVIAPPRSDIDPDPSSVRHTFESEFAQEVELLRRVIETPQITSSGPFACPKKTP